MAPEISVLMAASEVFPFSKTGGLADVLGALPRELAARGVRVATVVPFHRRTGGRLPDMIKIISALEVRQGSMRQRVSVYRSDLGERHSVYLVRHDPSFDRPGLYGPPGGDGYPDNAERFGLFSKALVRLLDRLDKPPDLVHVHDWQTALVPLLLGGRLPTVFTIHNLGYQGIFPPETLDRLGLPREVFNMEGLEFWGQVNFLKAGVAWSDAVTTVSPRYAQEIQTPEQGFGLDGFLRRHSGKLRGILNGADYDHWNPGADPFIAAPFGPADLEGKAVCRRDLLERFGLPPGGDAAVVGMTSRLVPQKGIDLLVAALPELATLDLHLVILGTGEGHYEAALLEAASSGQHLRVRLGFDEETAHKIVAGADIFLMPSRYEPCGLSQMYSLRYGTVPVVRATGGLMDTVEPCDPRTGSGTGFLFAEESPAALAAAVRAALELRRDRDRWRELMRRGMSRDFSWGRSAEGYLGLYRGLLAARGA